MDIMNRTLNQSVITTGPQGEIDEIMREVYAKQPTVPTLKFDPSTFIILDTPPLAKETVSKSTGMKLKLIPAGSFTMGSPDSERKDDKHGLCDNESPQREVQIPGPFYMGVYEVTQAEYEQVMGINPSYYSKTGEHDDGRTKVRGMDTSNFPVDNVTWYKAIEFCNELSIKDGLEPHYAITNRKKSKWGAIESATIAAPASGHRGYRLPTEAEWEYACRANTTTPFHFGSVLDGDKANSYGFCPGGTATNGNALSRPTAVGSYKPNSFGLYDMHGNVFEWCCGVYNEQDYGHPFGGVSAPDFLDASDRPQVRMKRGGSHHWGALHCRSASRQWDYAGPFPSHDTGFRVVRNATNKR